MAAPDYRIAATAQPAIGSLTGLLGARPGGVADSLATTRIARPPRSCGPTRCPYVCLQPIRSYHWSGTAPIEPRLRSEVFRAPLAGWEAPPGRHQAPPRRCKVGGAKGRSSAATALLRHRRQGAIRAPPRRCQRRQGAFKAPRRGATAWAKARQGVTSKAPPRRRFASPRRHHGAPPRQRPPRAPHVAMRRALARAHAAYKAGAARNMQAATTRSQTQATLGPLPHGRSRAARLLLTRRLLNAYQRPPAPGRGQLAAYGLASCSWPSAYPWPPRTGRLLLPSPRRRLAPSTALP